mmetsp:Transcript_5774/g.14042  ORF Transcript_5774/g.14042 Transcript_5774/m.14042 type:complete len:234 (+) Transcript_5774:103-804(+)
MGPPGVGPMDPEEVEEIQRYLPGGGTKTLRACLQCRTVMNREQFFEMGCPNCKELPMQGNDGRVVACTTANFQGFISLIRPGAFLSRFTGLEHRRPGCYALTVKGSIPDNILREAGSDTEALVPGRSAARKRAGIEVEALPPSEQEDKASSDAGSVPKAADGPAAVVATAATPGSKVVPEPLSPPTPQSPANSAQEGGSGAEEQAEKKRKLDVMAGEQAILLEPEEDEEFAGL